MKIQAPARILLFSIAIAIVDRFVVGYKHEPTQETTLETQEQQEAETTTTTTAETIILGWNVETYTNTSIVGGKQSDPDEFPYFVDLTICAGTLIAPRIVLTAAHCAPQNFIGKEVTVGAYRRDDRMDPNKRIKVVDGVTHPRFGRKKALNNDFGLLLLERPYTAIYDSPIRLFLNKNKKFPRKGQELKAVGMGTTSWQGKTADTLRDVSIPAMPRKECRKIYEGKLTNRMMCAGTINGGKDACQGDSGGPLVVARNNNNDDNNNIHYLVGVTSWGRNCGIFPGVYSKVSRVTVWIRNQVCTVWNVGTPEICKKESPQKKNTKTTTTTQEAP